MGKYTVMVDDNFHYQDSEERYQQGTYDDSETARAVCMRIVDDSLKSLLRSGMSATELFNTYKSFGDDPFVIVTEGGDPKIQFSAWEYAQEQCRLLCAAAPDQPGATHDDAASEPTKSRQR